MNHYYLLRGWRASHRAERAPYPIIIVYVKNISNNVFAGMHLLSVAPSKASGIFFTNQPRYTAVCMLPVVAWLSGLGLPNPMQQVGVDAALTLR